MSDDHKKHSAHHPALPASAKDAVQQCQDYFRAMHISPNAPPVALPPRQLTPAEVSFEKKVDGIENRADAALYTPEHYSDEIIRTKQYADTFIDNWSGKLPKGRTPEESRQALKQKFYAIIDGAAGMETGWSADTVRGSRNAAHTGVFQENWDFMQGALGVYRDNPAAMQALQKHPDDAAALKFSTQAVARNDPPATAFAGQGAAFAAMAMQSYENFVKGGGRPDNFSGSVLYQDHLLGLAGGEAFRGTLQAAAHSKGHPGVSNRAYDGNYLVISRPKAPINDLNPERKVFANATAADVGRMLHDKFVNERNRLAGNGASEERLAAFESAFLPEWKNAAVKESDIARVKQLHALGNELRESPEAQENACRVLAPMPPLKSAKPAGPAK